MKHLGTLPLTAGAYRLRRAVMRDAPAAYRNFLSISECWRYLRSVPIRSLSEAQKFLSACIARYQDVTQYFWLICDASDQPIGFVSVSFSAGGSQGTLEYVLGRAWWGKGIMTDCLREVLRFMFDEVGVRRIEGVCAAGNPASAAVMKKAGMQYEGTHPLALRTGEGAHPCERYAMFLEDAFPRSAKK